MEAGQARVRPGQARVACDMSIGVVIAAYSRGLGCRGAAAKSGPGHFWRTASISRLIDTLSPTTTPPPSIGRQCCVDRSQSAGDWFGDVVREVLSVRRLPVSAGGDRGRRPLVPPGTGCPTAIFEELLAEHGVTVDHVTICRWVQRFTAEFIEVARPCRHVPGDRVVRRRDVYVKVAGRWTYLYRAIDQYGQVIDVLLSQRRDLAAARRFFTRALRRHDPGRGHHPTAPRPIRGSSTS